MADRRTRPGRRTAEPGDGWSISETSLGDVSASVRESLFTVGNGFIGVRGRAEDGVLDGGRAADTVYLNGVYERVPIAYHEQAFGYATHSDTRLPVPDATGLDVLVDGQPFAPDRGAIGHHQRCLDLRAGVLRRTARWTAPAGGTVELTFERCASFARDRLYATRLTILPVGFSGTVEVVSHVVADPMPRPGPAAEVYDPRVGPTLAESPWQLERHVAGPAGDGFLHRARASGFGVATLVSHAVERGDLISQASRETADGLEWRFVFAAIAGQPIHVVKLAAYDTDRSAREHDAVATAARALEDAMAAGFDAILAEQADYMSAFWQRARLDLAGDAASQRAVRFNMFQLLQAAGRDGATSVAAKGQTGEGYEGHYFWDAEIFALPFFAFTAPDIARKLLEYRHARLDAARRLARRMGHTTGALFPWRTIGGDECSAYFPAGAAQYHIVADIAHAVRQYVDATQDTDFLVRMGAELVFETARIWPQVGFFNPRRDGRFCINEVTGPDEYSALVNNNLYTNAMARAHLEFAHNTAAMLSRTAPDAYDALCRKLDLGAAEVEGWAEAAERMYLPYDPELGVPLQDDALLDRQEWDFDNTPAERYPLLLHYHPLTIYRYRVCKQADAVLALFLQGDRFDHDDKCRAFDFYERLTVHDSTLSACIYSILASEVGRADKAWTYFQDTALVDLEDRHANTAHGLHMAAMAGSWMAVVFGFAGMRAHGGTLSFRPVVPHALDGYAFGLVYQGRRLAIARQAGHTTYELVDGRDLSILHNDRTLTLTAGQPTRVPDPPEP